MKTLKYHDAQLSTSTNRIRPVLHSRPDDFSHIYKLNISQSDIPSGNAACTSIAFATAFRLSVRMNIHQIIDMDWEYTIELGVNIWRAWNKEKNPLSKESKRGGVVKHYQVFEDIESVSFLKELMDKTMPHELRKEFGGSMSVKDNYIANKNAGQIDENGKLYKVYNDIEDVIDYMKYLSSKIKCPSVGIICVGDMSMALWINGHGDYVIYDSHCDSKGKSTLYIFKRGSSLCSCLRNMPIGLGGAQSLLRPMCGASAFSARVFARNGNITSSSLVSCSNRQYNK